MNRVALWRLALPAIALACAATFVLPARGQIRNAPYPRMAPLGQYLMERNAEIALARSAAPPAISKNASIAVLTPRGYVTVVRGSNGFTCIVERDWMSAFDDPQFWNPKGRGPVCYNPPASRSVLSYDYARAKLVLSGLTKSQMYARLTVIVAKNALPTPEPGSMSYMMSKQQYLNDDAGNWRPHLMFHVPKADGANAGASWGANLPDSPVLMDSDHKLSPEPEALFFVPLAKWSDGTAAHR